MFYAILGIVVVVALILIFRDDHDKSYNRNEKKDNRKETSQPKADAKSGPKAEPKAAIDKAMKEAGQKLICQRQNRPRADLGFLS